MSKKTLLYKGKLIILALVLLVPGFLYWAVGKLGSNQYVRLPVYGHKELSGEMKRNWGREYPDTIFHTVPELALNDVQRGPIHFMESDTSISVVHLFYGRDDSFSKLMLDHVDALASRFQAIPLVQFYSVSVDSTDTAERIRGLLKDYKDLDKKHWYIGLHPDRPIFEYAREQLLIDAMIDPADSSRFLISNQLVLIDGKHRIRGFYDISVKGEVGRLEDEIKLLTVEELRNRSTKIEQR